MRSLFYILLILVACNNAKKSSDQTKEQTENVMIDEDNQLMITDTIFAMITRSACFGECPEYKIFVYPDGSVKYKGVNHVDLIGDYSSNISTAQMREILDEAIRINYFEMNDVYDGYITDVPSCVTLISGNGKRHQIYNRAEAPENLNQFQRYLDKILLNLDYKTAK